MKNYPYFLYTTIGLLFLYVGIALIGTSFLMKNHLENALTATIETAKQEARTISSMGEDVTERKQKEQLQERIQKSINFSENQLIFNSLLDWSGKYICYSDKRQIGKIAPQNDELKLNDQSELNGKTLYNFLFKRDTSSATSHIILLTPIKGSDWIVGSHINKERVLEEASLFRNRLYSTFAVIGLITLLFVFGAVRVISLYYQRLLALKNSRLEDGVLNLSKLNTSLEKYQNSLTEFQTTQEQNLNEKQESSIALPLANTENPEKNIKKRLLTYVRNEMLPVATEDISYIYVENTITYIIRKDGKRSTTGETLDLIYSNLDARFFFRVNRQIIVAISAIKTITKFGNSKLKIQVNPDSEIDIIIGKNKAAAFKQWLDL